MLGLQVRALTIAATIGLASLLAPSPASAVRAARTPTPEQLWDAYPLRPHTDTASATRAATAATPRPAGAPASRGVPTGAIELIAALALVLVPAFVVLRRGRQSSQAPPETLPPAVVARPREALPPRRPAARHYPPPTRPAPPAPPPPPGRLVPIQPRSLQGSGGSQ